METIGYAVAGGALIRLLTCQVHGETKWQGHVMCDGCGETFQTRDPRAARHAPEVCRCGQRLMPPAKEAVGGDPLGLHTSSGVVAHPDGKVEAVAPHEGVDWTARPICYLCYRKVQKQFKGRVPVERARNQAN